jgi:hypothetical protein
MGSLGRDELPLIRAWFARHATTVLAPGRDRVLAIRCSRSSAHSTIESVNTPLGRTPLRGSRGRDPSRDNFRRDGGSQSPPRISKS